MAGWGVWEQEGEGEQGRVVGSPPALGCRAGLEKGRGGAGGEPLGDWLLGLGPPLTLGNLSPRSHHQEGQGFAVAAVGTALGPTPRTPGPRRLLSLGPPQGTVVLR